MFMHSSRNCGVFLCKEGDIMETDTKTYAEVREELFDLRIKEQSSVRLTDIELSTLKSDILKKKEEMIILLVKEKGEKKR